MPTKDDGPFLVLWRLDFGASGWSEWMSSQKETMADVYASVSKRSQYKRENRVYRLADVLSLPYLRAKPVEIEFEEVESDAEAE